MIWFTSDTHFFHANVIKYCGRPFSSIEEHDEQLVRRWNHCVQRGDTVYHLGDFAVANKVDEDRVDALLQRLNGQKFLITGNHERDAVTRNKRWCKVTPYHEIKADFGDIHKQRIVMCHYALRTWNGMHRGSWMLHGHSHGNLPDIGGKIMDVGTDCHGYAPVNIQTVKAIMRLRPFVAVDHHEPDED